MITLQGVPNKQILSNEVNLLELQSILVYQVLVNGMTMREVVLQGHLQGFYIIYTKGIIIIDISNTLDESKHSNQVSAKTLQASKE